jgi:hypothetical protein
MYLLVNMLVQILINIDCFLLFISLSEDNIFIQIWKILVELNEHICLINLHEDKYEDENGDECEEKNKNVNKDEDDIFIIMWKVVTHINFGILFTIIILCSRYLNSYIGIFLIVYFCIFTYRDELIMIVVILSIIVYTIKVIYYVLSIFIYSLTTIYKYCSKLMCIVWHFINNKKK